MKHPETITGVMWSLLRVTLNAFIDTDTTQERSRVAIEHYTVNTATESRSNTISPTDAIGRINIISFTLLMDIQFT